MTLYHLLTMTTGEEWKEFGNGVVFPNDFVESANWVQYILEKPIIEEPATKMNYNSGSSHLLSYIIQKLLECRQNSLRKGTYLIR